MTILQALSQWANMTYFMRIETKWRKQQTTIPTTQALQDEEPPSLKPLSNLKINH